MNKMRKFGSIFIVLTLILIFSLSSMVLAQEDSSSTDSGKVSQSTIDRIKRVATQSGSLTNIKRKIAFIGTIEKIANETLTIKTKDDIELASTSATTTYVRSPGSTSQKLEDVSIGDYAIAMGFVNGSEVLETKRVILSSSAPDATKKTSFAGAISYIESDAGVIHILFDGVEVSVEVTRNTDLLFQNGSDQDEIDFSDLKKGQFISTIYLPLADPDEFTHPKALTILATSIIKELPVEEPIASESAQMGEYLDEEEVEPTNPPELAL